MGLNHRIVWDEKDLKDHLVKDHSSFRGEERKSKGGVKRERILPALLPAPPELPYAK